MKCKHVTYGMNQSPNECPRDAIEGFTQCVNHVDIQEYPRDLTLRRCKYHLSRHPPIQCEAIVSGQDYCKFHAEILQHKPTTTPPACGNNVSLDHVFTPKSEDSSKALRYNTGKVDYTLLPLDALEAETRVWMTGVKKYGRHNWEKLWGVDTLNVVTASMLRHLFARMNGEILDPETGLPHMAHIRCNAAMLIRYDAEPTPVSTPENIKKP